MWAYCSNRAGIVLLAGGSSKGEALNTAEIFEPADDRVTQAGLLTAARSFMTAAVLEDGRAMAIGGVNAAGLSRSCGVLTPTLQVQFTQSRYQPGAKVVLTGKIEGVPVTTVNVQLTLELKRVDLTTGQAVAANERLITRTLTLSSTLIPKTSVVNVVREDIGGDFILTVRGPGGITAQARYGARLQPMLQLLPATPAIVGQPVHARLQLTADGAPVNMAGTLTFVAGTRTAATTTSGVVPSFVSELSVCCETAAGTLQLTGRFSGNSFLEPATAGPIAQAVGSNVSTVRILPGTLKLQESGTVEVEISVDADAEDAKAPPSGNVTLLRGGTAVATLPITTGVLNFSGPRRVRFSYTPVSADRRTSPCFTAWYDGETRYLGSVSAPLCIGVGPATSSLTGSSVSAVTYTLGETQTLTARLTWPDAVGIVGRIVNVTGGTGSSIASVNLTPDPTDRGIATGTASVKLPFQAGRVQFSYPASGDLAASTVSVDTTMRPVRTTMTITAPSPTTNPFNIRYTLQFNTGGMSLPAQLNAGGHIEFYDGAELLAVQPVAVSQSPTSNLADSSSNTIVLGETLDPTVRGLLPTVIRPVGTRSIRVRYTGSALFQASESTVPATVQ